MFYAHNAITKSLEYSFVNLHVEMADVLDCNLEVTEFELQQRNYIHFWTHTLGKDVTYIGPKIRPRYVYVKCTYVHRMYIHIGIRKTRNWFRYEIFIYLFEFKVLRHGERDTQFLTMLTVRTSSAVNSLTQPTREHPVDPKWSRLGDLRKSTRPSKSKSQLTAIFQIPKSSALRKTSFTSPVPFPIWVFYCDICDCHILPAHA